jgi:hypothetical protein
MALEFPLWFFDSLTVGCELTPLASDLCLFISASSFDIEREEDLML